MSRLQRSSSLPALRADGLRAGWGRADLLRGMDLRVAPGERLAVLGPNGAGKTTLFDALGGRLPLRAGRVFLGCEDVTRAPLHRRALLGLGYVPQEPSAFLDLSVRDNLAVAARSPAAGGSRLAPDAVERAMHTWSLSALADRPAGALSGGERRRLEVARTLLIGPTLLMLDEPFAGLDPAGRRTLRAGLLGLPPEVALVVTDHAADDVLALCDRVLLLVDGKLAFDGPTASFGAGDPAWRRYFGQDGGPA